MTQQQPQPADDRTPHAHPATTVQLSTVDPQSEQPTATCLHHKWGRDENQDQQEASGVAQPRAAKRQRGHLRLSQAQLAAARAQHHWEDCAAPVFVALSATRMAAVTKTSVFYFDTAQVSMSCGNLSSAALPRAGVVNPALVALSRVA